MPCEKTGAQFFIEPYGEYVWCDAFLMDNTSLDQKDYIKVLHTLIGTGLSRQVLKPILYLRIAGRSFTPINSPILHGVVHDYDNWFDKDLGNSTLITNNYTYHGYHGVPINAQ